MILLDTNVISEAMKPEPSPTVLAWLNDQVAETLYLSSVTLAELLYGIGSLPDDHRKNTFASILKGLLTLFEGRILPFDTQAASHYAELAISARKSGKGFPLPDGYIAAIAAAKGYTVATRDTSPYLAGGVKTINPWEPGI